MPFFPFVTAWMWPFKEGISAIVQPGGSLRDFEVIEACNEGGSKGFHGLYRPQRAFKH
jgi:phosphoribosylaminoimidazolecarboxamide formyltransferase/IMP cyclohydrolase